MILFKNVSKNNVLFFLLLLISFSLFIPSAVSAAATNIPPTIVIKSIKVVDGSTTITGTVSDDQTLPQEIVMNLVGESDTPDPITPSSDGTWSITKTLSQKLNRLKIEATDKPLDTEAPNVTSIPVQRPYITSIHMKAYKYNYKVQGNGTEGERDEIIDVDLMQNEDLTRISINPTTILIDLSDDVSRSLSNPVTIYDRNFTKISDVGFEFIADNQIKLTLNNLLPGKTYYLIFNPSLISVKYSNDGAGLFLDANNNDFLPLIKKFTTVSEYVKSENPDIKTAINEYTAELPQQPHGFYTNNVNTCGNCHSTHVSEKRSLDNPIQTYKDNAKENSYCMACHDGTVAVPMPVNYDSKNNLIKSMHTAVEDSEHPSSAGSCTTCHNPHLTWKKDNPNHLKDHYVYTANGSSRDSLDDNCQSCHDGDSISGPVGYHENSVREVLSYKKSTTANGQIGNYSLCLRCHNGGKKTTDMKDIKQFYEDQDTNEIIKSGHTITAIDGSFLNGNLPCAECHETHGSKNLVLLKDLLGHENQQEFSFTAGDWANKEREFCLKCHNSKTRIYGVTGRFNETLTEHLDTLKACSECHGGTGTPEVQALRAAHGPVILKKPVTTDQTTQLSTTTEPTTQPSTTTDSTTKPSTTTDPTTQPSTTTDPTTQPSTTTDPTTQPSTTTDQTTQPSTTTEPNIP
jgi:hypothetical protein